MLISHQDVSGVYFSHIIAKPLFNEWNGQFFGYLLCCLLHIWTPIILIDGSSWPGHAMIRITRVRKGNVSSNNFSALPAHTRLCPVYDDVHNTHGPVRGEKTHAMDDSGWVDDSYVGNVENLVGMEEKPSQFQPIAIVSWG